MPRNIKDFVNKWAGKGNEKQDTQKFWNGILYDVLGAPSSTDIHYEKPVKINGQTKFIDAYLPDTRVLIEQKSLGIDLMKAELQSDGMKLTPYEQGRRYGGYLPFDEQPRWIIDSNFEEIRVHDMKKPGEAPEILLPVFTGMLINRASLIGIVFTGISFIIIAAAFMVPIMIYSEMITAEFYDNLNNEPMNDIRSGRRNGRPARTSLTLLIVLTVLSCILVAIPVAKADLTQLRSGHLALDKTAQERKNGSGSEDVQEEALDEEEGESDPYVTDESVPETPGRDLSSFKVPEGYTLSSEDEELAYYENGEHYIEIYKFAANDKLDDYAEEKSAEIMKIGNTEGYFFKVGYDDYPVYTFAFVEGDYEYDVSSDVKEVVIRIVEASM